MLLSAGETTESDEQSFAAVTHSRSSVRYIRKDLKTYLTKYALLSATHLKTTLLDISSGGVQVVASKKIRVNKKVTVNVCFFDGYKFEIGGKIVRAEEQCSYLYKLEYEALNSYIDAQKSTFRRVYMLIAGKLSKTKYRNVTSDCIQILSDAKIDSKQKIKLVFEFSNGETIERNAKVTYFKKITKYHYGIRFERKNQLLGNYLLKTQKSLVFAN